MNKNEVKALLKKSSSLKFSKFGIKGGSQGPMTCTNAHLNQNNNVEFEVLDILRSEGFKKEDGYITNGTLSFMLVWNTYPTYKFSQGYDPTYITHWASIHWK